MTDQGLDISVYVDQNIQSIADLNGLVQEYTRDSLPVRNVFKAGSWELFDKVYAMSDDGSISTEQQTILLEATRLICIHARPREVLLMVLEKISGCSDVFPFQLLLHAMMLLIANSNDLAVWRQVLDAIIRKANALSTPARPHAKEAELSDDEEDNNHFAMKDAEKDRSGAFVDSVLTAAKELMLRLLERASQDQSATQPFTDLVIGFLLNLNAVVIANLTDPAARHRYFAATSVLLLDIGDMHYIFSHIHRIRHAVHRQELSAARAQFVRHYCNKHSFTQTDLYASTALTTDDTNALLNRMSQSEYSDVLVSYFDHASGLATSTAPIKDSPVSWSQCVFWDDLLTYQPDENSSTNDKDSAIGTDAFPQWNLTGIALFALHILQATKELPLVYNRAQLVTVLQPYVLLLLRDKKLSNPEGLQLATLVLTRPSSPHVQQAPCVPIFMSFLAQQTSAASYNHLMLSFCNCLSSRQKNIPGKVFWGAQDAAKLGSMSAATNNFLALTQSFITAMAGCADTSLRTASFNSLRDYLKNIEERSLFGLLLVLTEHCPYPNMAGLLIDLTKECVQAASKGLSWTRHPSTLSHLPTNGDTAKAMNANTAALPWIQECIDSTMPPVGKKKGFPLSKILKRKVSPADTPSLDATSEQTVDVDDFTLVSSKRRSVQANNPAAVHPSPVDEHCYIDLHTGTTELETDKYIEVREAIPFMHTGKSPFWSPLVLQRFVLEPLRDTVEHASPDKILEGLDIIAARVNLTQAIALKCLTDVSLQSTDTTTASTESVAGVLDAYFEGCKLYTVSGAQVEVFPYAYSKLAAVKDIFALYFLLKQLRSAILRAQKSLPAVATPWEVVRVQLLLSNVDYASGHMKTLCNKLHVLLAQTAE